jgi:hypothetical protein
MSSREQRNPEVALKLATAKLTADCLRFSFRAVAEKLPVSATASAARIWSSERPEICMVLRLSNFLIALRRILGGLTREATPHTEGA